MKLLIGVCVVLIKLAYFVNEVRLQKMEIADDNDDQQSSDVKTLSKNVEALKKVIAAFGRQMLLQQLFVEERIRSDADSGVKQVRLDSDGTRNYYTATHTGRSVVSIHDHSNNIRTVGMGEFVGVLNGVEFRTRHNDYRLYMPHRTKKDWHATENIPFPNVPPQVLSKNTVAEQVEEMRQWFLAWKNQDHSRRDYRKYFKPVLCYLEGAWTTSTTGDIEEPFESDRHFVDASSWFDLQEKVRFTSYTGRKDNLENFSFLPTTIINITQDGYPDFAQWNYRILCHPISRDLPLNRLRVIDELGSRMSNQRTFKEHEMSRSARFQVNPFDTDTWTERKNGAKWGLLDELMSEIPGKDNYQGKLEDNAFDLMALSKDPKLNKATLNAARYHRWFEAAKNDAMGISTRHRGFADENLFMAINTQPKVAGMDLTSCRRRPGEKKKVCKTINQKWSYAVPLEIIYLTPLSKWNPYDIQYKGDSNSLLGKTVEAGNRNGGLNEGKAYNGSHSRKFYMTPVEFFSGKEVGTEAADTTRNTVGVLDKTGEVRKCKASGTRIFFPSIAGVGVLRQRYPIMPVHGEGSSVWKELEATKDLLLRSKTYGYMFHEPLQSGPLPTEPPRKDITLSFRNAKKTPPGAHKHEITLTADQVDDLKNGGSLNVTSTQSAGHDHDVEISWFSRKDLFVINKCDSEDKGNVRCGDRHPKWLDQIRDQ